jgi:hypothetical protein
MCEAVTGTCLWVFDKQVSKQATTAKAEVWVTNKTREFQPWKKTTALNTPP